MNNISWNVGEMANISWNPSSLVIDDLVMTTDVKVDISLWIYNGVTEVFEENTILATDMPNSGFASITLLESMASRLPSSDYGLHTATLKVTVNSSTTRSKRASVGSILRNAGKFGKPGVIAAAAVLGASVGQRLLCEVWSRNASPFPRRSIPPCPCTTEDAGNDDRFEVETSPESSRRFFHQGSSRCYRQANVR